MDQISIAALGVLVGMGVGIFGVVRTGKKEVKEDTTQVIRMEVKIDGIAKVVDDIRLDVKDHGRKFDGTFERITRCEEQIKHHIGEDERGVQHV